MDAYKTIKEPVENFLYKEKASKFIGFAYPVDSEAAIKERLAAVRSLHTKATHHCYAYRLGLDKNNYRTHDDGEPNGTAGKPIIGQMDSLGITNCLIIVVRYFGGTKLGVSGLIDAYKETAKETLAAATFIERKILDYYTITCDYTFINRAFQIIHKLHGVIIRQEIDNTVLFLIGIEQDKSRVLEKELSEQQFPFQFVERK
ncbi:MAG: YigZ family protein [Sphingobacteriales bacterium]|nr:YigZ family protein [Sphingobacteriales bacterium]